MLIGSLLLSFILTLMPWTAVLSIKYGEFIFISTNGGEVFRGSNNIHATPTSYVKRIEIPNTLLDRMRDLTEAEKDRLLYREGFGFIKDHPRQFIKLYVGRMFNFWRLRPIHQSRNEHTNTKNAIIASISYGIILMFSVTGLLLSYKHWKKLYLIYFMFISFVMTYSLYYTKYRFRMPLDPFLIMLSSYSVCAAASSIKSLLSSAARFLSFVDPRSNVW